MKDLVELDEAGDIAIGEDGLPTIFPAPITKDIGSLVEKGKVNNLDRFARDIAYREQIDWANEYLEYLLEVDEVNEFNDNLPEPQEDEGGNLVAVDPKELPEEPIRPTLKTVEDVLAPYQRRISKLKGLSFKGVNVALTETNQNGLSSISSALAIAKEFNLEDQFFPINFNAETAQGNKTVELLDIHEFKEFGLQFMLARKEYFE